MSLRYDIFVSLSVNGNFTSVRTKNAYESYICLGRAELALSDRELHDLIAGHEQHKGLGAEDRLQLAKDTVRAIRKGQAAVRRRVAYEESLFRQKVAERLRDKAEQVAACLGGAHV